jgi:hypothetical protein
MYMLKYDVGGDFEMNMPTDEAGIITLGEAYVRFEETLVPDEALHDIASAEIKAALDAAQNAVTARRAGETDRAVAAARFLQMYKQVRPLLDRVITHLKSRHADNLADLEVYGLKTNAHRRGVTVRKPANPLDWLKFANTYLEQEGHRPASDRISDPPFSELTRLIGTLNLALQQREAGLIQRERSVAARRAATQHLRNLLQVAAAIRIVKHYQGCVNPELASWGYPIVARKGS